MKQFSDFTKSLQEKKSPELYYTSYSAAIDAALKYAEAEGFDYNKDDVWEQISIGSKKPSVGKTVRASISLTTKSGKHTRKRLHIQVYGMEGGKYELNTYVS